MAKCSQIQLSFISASIWGKTEENNSLKDYKYSYQQVCKDDVRMLPPGHHSEDRTAAILTARKILLGLKRNCLFYLLAGREPMLYNTTVGGRENEARETICRM